MKWQYPDNRVPGRENINRNEKIFEKIMQINFSKLNEDERPVLFLFFYIFKCIFYTFILSTPSTVKLVIQHLHKTTHAHQSALLNPSHLFKASPHPLCNYPIGNHPLW